MNRSMSPAMPPPSLPTARSSPRARSPIDPRALRSARQHFIATHYCTHALTLVWNAWPVTLTQIRSDLRHLHACVDRALYGARFHRRPAHERSDFIAVVEGVDHHPHVHTAWNVLDSRWNTFSGLFERRAIWNQIAPAGSHDLVPINDAAGWAGYAVKALHHAGGDDAVILSREFLSH